MGRPAVPWAPHGGDGVGSVHGQMTSSFRQEYRNATLRNPTLIEYAAHCLRVSVAMLVLSRRGARPLLRARSRGDGLVGFLGMVMLAAALGDVGGAEAGLFGWVAARDGQALGRHAAAARTGFAWPLWVRAVP